MLVAIVGTLLRHRGGELSVDLHRFLSGFRDRRAVGVPDADDRCSAADRNIARVRRLAAALIGTAEYYRHTPSTYAMVALVFEILLGFLTFTGSLMAFAKLQELIPGGRWCTAGRTW